MNQNIEVIKSLEKMLLVMNQKMRKGYFIATFEIFDDIKKYYRLCENRLPVDDMKLLNKILIIYYNKFIRYCIEWWIHDLNDILTKELEYVNNNNL